MRNQVRGLMVAGTLAVGVTAAVLFVAPLAGQSPGRAPAYKAPRAADGHADLNGIWQAMNTANWDLEPHAARAALAFQKGPYGPLPAKEVLHFGAVGSVPGGLGVVEGGPIPYKPAALATRNENREKWLERDPEIKCYLPGVPRATYMPYPFQIVQTKGYVLLAYEYAGAVRNVYLKDPGPPQTPAWMGQSVGHWDGDTFVVVATGFDDRTWFDRAGNHHSDQLKVTERYTPIDRNALMYEATIEDPETFTRPWKISMPLYRRLERNAQLMEFKCVEFVEELMYGHLRKNPLPR